MPYSWVYSIFKYADLQFYTIFDLLTVFKGIFGALEIFFGSFPWLALFNNFVTDLFGVFLGLYVTVFVREQDKKGAIGLCKKQTKSYLCLESKND